VIIKFSHAYEKMPPDFKVSRLLEIEVVQLENLSGKFLDDDTRIVGGGYYPLPKKGKYMILRLESSIMNIPWQTIRRWTPKKEIYYRKYVGKRVDCKITIKEGT
jgi:hypothetical protein